MPASKNTYHNSEFRHWQQDPVFGEDFSNLSENELNQVIQVSDSVNRKISSLTAQAPFFFRHFRFIALSSVMITLIIAAFLLFQQENHDKPHISVRYEKGLQINPVDEPNELNMNKNPQTNDQLIQSELMNPGSEKKSNPHLSRDSSKTRKPIQDPDPEKQTGGGPEPTNDPVKPNNQHDDTRSFAQDDNKLVFLRIADVQVLSKVNAADNQSPKSNNKDVTNPNIGGSVVTKTKSNEYSLNDMPYYNGGDQGFISYVIRNLSYKIQLPKKEAVSSVNVRFEVNAKGHVENIQIPGKVPESIQRVVSKVISDSEWNPGKKSGKKGTIEVSIMIHFYF